MTSRQDMNWKIEPQSHDGYVVVSDGDWHVVYNGTLQGTHQFRIFEKFEFRADLGQISLDKAVEMMYDLKSQSTIGV